MNPVEHHDPIFPVMGILSPAPRLRAPRLAPDCRPAEVDFGNPIYPGAWSMRRARMSPSLAGAAGQLTEAAH
jgi:hypothetical protein